MKNDEILRYLCTLWLLLVYPLHSDSHPYKCTEPGCSYAGKTKNTLIRHVNFTQSTLRAYKCTEAGFRSSFKRRGNYKRHLRTVHSKNAE